jgi:hypothetical protein
MLESKAQLAYAGVRTALLPLTVKHMQAASGLALAMPKVHCPKPRYFGAWICPFGACICLMYCVIHSSSQCDASFKFMHIMLCDGAEGASGCWQRLLAPLQAHTCCTHMHLQMCSCLCHTHFVARPRYISVS